MPLVRQWTKSRCYINCETLIRRVYPRGRKFASHGIFCSVAPGGRECWKESIWAEGWKHKSVRTRRRPLLVTLNRWRHKFVEIPETKHVKMCLKSVHKVLTTWALPCLAEHQLASATHLPSLVFSTFRSSFHELAVQLLTTRKTMMALRVSSSFPSRFERFHSILHVYYSYDLARPPHTFAERITTPGALRSWDTFSNGTKRPKIFDGAQEDCILKKTFNILWPTATGRWYFCSPYPDLVSLKTASRLHAVEFGIRNLAR